MNTTTLFETHYPVLADWVNEHEGWIEIGSDEYSDSLVRVLDLGGMVWESKKRYRTIDDALADVEKAITDWLA